MARTPFVSVRKTAEKLTSDLQKKKRTRFKCPNITLTYKIIRVKQIRVKIRCSIHVATMNKYRWKYQLRRIMLATLPTHWEQVVLSTVHPASANATNFIASYLLMLKLTLNENVVAMLTKISKYKKNQPLCSSYSSSWYSQIYIIKVINWRLMTPNTSVQCDKLCSNENSWYKTAHNCVDKSYNNE